MFQKLVLLGLSEIIFCLLLWLAQPDMAFIFTVCVSVVAAAILVVSLIADRIEASRIAHIYYYSMAVTIIAPLLVYAATRFLGL